MTIIIIIIIISRISTHYDCVTMSLSAFTIMTMLTLVISSSITVRKRHVWFLYGDQPVSMRPGTSFEQFLSSEEDHSERDKPSVECKTRNACTSYRSSQHRVGGVFCNPAAATNGVSTDGVTANFLFFDRGTCWVLQ